MKNMLVAFPEISEQDLQWIQNFRSKNDVHFKEIKPHFTLLFPDLASHQSQFQTELEEIAKHFKAFDFVIRAAHLMPKNFEGDYNYVFLIPDEGHSQILRLHDLIYRKSQRPRLRLDLPFIPHITIGNQKDAYRCKALVDEINKTPIEIKGRISNLTFLENPGEGWTEKLNLKLA